MENIIRILDQLSLETSLTLEDIPNIDLYMDQVIQLFESKFNGTKRNEDEKVLTKTMINNYAKGKLIFPIRNKKYSKEHLILISLIYQLKGSLSINDIKVTLDGVNNRIMKEDIQLDSLYNSYLNLADKNVENFNKDITKRVTEVNEAVAKIGEGNSENLAQVLMVASLIHMSNVYRKVAEKIVDEIGADMSKKGNKKLYSI